MLAGHVFHHPIRGAAFADHDLFYTESFGHADDSLGNLLGLLRMANKRSEVDRLKIAQGPLLASRVHDGSRGYD